MLFMSDYDNIQGLARTTIITLTLIMVIGAIVIGIFVLLASRKPEKTLSKNYFIGISLFSILFGLGRLVYLIHDYFLSDEYDIILWKIATAIVLCGLIIFLYTLETFVYKKTKRIFTGIGIFLLAMVIILERDTARIFLYIGYAILFLVPFLIYLNVYINATGIVKKRAAIILIGMIVIFLGQGTAIFEALGIMDTVTASIFAPPVSLVGLSITSYGFISMAR